MKRSDGGKEENREERPASNEGVPQGGLALAGKNASRLEFAWVRRTSADFARGHEQDRT